jgi:phage terminase Nu1 subunit (DNA packaging protein)
MKLDETATCSAAELSWLLGVTERAVRGYASKGLAVRAKRGRYLLGQSVRRIHHHVAEEAAGRSGSELASARSKLADVQREQVELKNAALRGEMVSKADMVDTGKAVLRGVRGMMLAWPSKAAFELAVLGPAERAVLERLVRDDLEDAALGRLFDLDLVEETSKGEPT